MNIEIKGKNILVHFNDWMFLQDDDILINKATVTKWGFNLGQLSLFFRRLN